MQTRNHVFHLSRTNITSSVGCTLVYLTSPYVVLAYLFYLFNILYNATAMTV